MSAALMTGMAVMVRQVSQELHPFQVAFARNLLGFIFLLPLFYRYGFDALKTNDLGWMAARGAFNAVAMLAFFITLISSPSRISPHLCLRFRYLYQLWQFSFFGSLWGLGA